jgi:hypothetical protein
MSEDQIKENSTVETLATGRRGTVQYVTANGMAAVRFAGGIAEAVPVGELRLIE